MANITINVPDSFVTLWNTRRTTWNARPEGALRPMPPATATQARLLMVNYMKASILREALRQSDAQYEADQAAVASV